MNVTVHVVNAFVDSGHGGNPAGVVLDADRLSQEQKQLIAARVGLPETAFISPSRSADFKLEFFTPNRRIAHCGHATIASFSYLQQAGRIGKSKTSKETVDGNREIHIEGDMAFMEQLAPKYIVPSDAAQGIDTAIVLSSLGLGRDDLLDGFEPLVVNTGCSFLIVPLKNEPSVQSATPRFHLIESVSEKFDLIGYYLFSPDTKVKGRHAGTRMFAPRYGIREEAATGMAAGPLACFLFDRIKISAAGTMLIEQGHLMSPPSPSVITVKLTVAGGRVQKLMAGGRAKLIDSRIIPC